MTTNTNKQKPKKENQLKNAIQLSGIGIQMGVIIYVFVLLGKWLDSNYNNGETLYYNHNTSRCSSFTLCCSKTT